MIVCRTEQDSAIRTLLGVVLAAFMLSFIAFGVVLGIAEWREPGPRLVANPGSIQYHREGCRHTKNAEPISEREIRHRGYMVPCPDCGAPDLRD